MTVYRANYGDALYGQDTYGLSGSVIDAAASITPICSVTTTAVKVFEGASTVTTACSVTASLQQVKSGASTVACTSSVTANSDTIIGGASATTCTSATTSSAIKVRTAAANIVCQGVVVTVAVEYPEVPGFRPGYGKNTYGSYIYGINHSVEEGAAAINLACNVTSAGIRIADAASNITLTSTMTGNGVIDVVGQANIALSSSVNIEYNRVRLMAASLNVAATVTIKSRYKWLDAPNPSTTWTDVSNPSTTWTEADYLERAA